MTDQADRLRQLVEDDGASRRSGARKTGRVHDAPQGSSGAISISATSHRPPARVIEAKPRRTSTYDPNLSLADTQPRLGHAIAVCSGKGGVGKTNIAVNLAVCMAQRGRQTCLVDADLGTANADVLCNLTPRYSLDHVMRGVCGLDEILLPGPGGFRLVPGGSGIERLANLPEADQRRIVRELSAMERASDSLIIDVAAGVGRNVTMFAAAARTVVIATTPEPTSMTDAYAMVKNIVRHVRGIDCAVVVNNATSEAEAADVFVRLNRVSQRFLDQSLRYAGAIPVDAHLRDSVCSRVPVCLFAPLSPSAQALRRLSDRLLGLESRVAAADDVTDRPSFFGRLGRWLRGAAFAEST